MRSTMRLALLALVCMTATSQSPEKEPDAAGSHTSGKAVNTTNSCQSNAAIKDICQTCIREQELPLTPDQCCQNPDIIQVCRRCQMGDVLFCLTNIQPWRNSHESLKIPTTLEGGHPFLTGIADHLDLSKAPQMMKKRNAQPLFSYGNQRNPPLMSKKWYNSFRSILTLFPQRLSPVYLNSRMWHQQSHPRRHVLKTMRKRSSPLPDDVTSSVFAEVAQNPLKDTQWPGVARNEMDADFSSGKSLISGLSDVNPYQVLSNLNVPEDSELHRIKHGWWNNLGLTAWRYPFRRPRVRIPQPVLKLMKAKAKRDNEQLKFSNYPNLQSQALQSNNMESAQNTPEEDTDLSQLDDDSFDFYLRLLFFVDSLRRSTEAELNELEDTTNGGPPHPAEAYPHIESRKSGAVPMGLSDTLSPVSPRYLTLAHILPRVLDIRQGVRVPDQQNVPSNAQATQKSAQNEIGKIDRTDDNGDIDNDSLTDKYEGYKDITYDIANETGDNNNQLPQQFALRDGEPYSHRAVEMERIQAVARARAAAEQTGTAHKRWGSLGNGKFRKWWMGQGWK